MSREKTGEEMFGKPTNAPRARMDLDAKDEERTARERAEEVASPRCTGCGRIRLWDGMAARYRSTMMIRDKPWHFLCYRKLQDELARQVEREVRQAQTVDPNDITF